MEENTPNIDPTTTNPGTDTAATTNPTTTTIVINDAPIMSVEELEKYIGVTGLEVSEDFRTLTAYDGKQRAVSCVLGSDGFTISKNQINAPYLETFTDPHQAIAAFQQQVADTTN